MVDNITGNTKYDKLTDIIIQEGIKSIGYSAFQGNQNLTNLVLPDSVEIIEDNAFMSCNNLTNLILSKNLNTLSTKCFYLNSNLTCVTMYNNVKSIQLDAFADCPNLKTINYTGTEEEWNTITKEVNWNWGCPSDMEIIYNYVPE